MIFLIAVREFGKHLDTFVTTNESCFDGSVGTYSLLVCVARVRGAMVPGVAYGVLIERIIYYPWGMLICDYNEK